MGQPSSGLMRGGCSIALLLLVIAALRNSSISDEISHFYNLGAAAGNWGVASILPFLFPFTALAGAILLLAPGMLLAGLLDKGRGDFGLWLIRGAGLTALGLALGLPLLDLLAPGLASGGGVVILLSLVSLSIVIWPRWGAARLASLQNLLAANHWILAFMALQYLAVHFAFMPKLYWEPFNGDGAQIFLAGLWLIENHTPLYPDLETSLDGYPSLSTLTEVYVASWNMRLFGENAIGLRQALPLGAALLTGLVLGLIAYQQETRLRLTVMALVALAVALFAWSLGWNASYNPYFSDLASPTLREPYVVFSLLAAMRISLEPRLIMVGLAMTLAYVTSPGAPAFLCFWIAAQ
ncbi:MAG: hypothetical protein ACPGVJ_12385, partial [Mangrovicoccus sp.]